MPAEKKGIPLDDEMIKAIVKAVKQEMTGNPGNPNKSATWFLNVFYLMLGTLAMVVSATWFLYAQIDDRPTKADTEQIVTLQMKNLELRLMDKEFRPLDKRLVSIETKLDVLLGPLTKK